VKNYRCLKEGFGANFILIYTSLTKGQIDAFKQFISNGNDSLMISDIFLKNKLKCLHLFCCFYEAGDKTYCKIIESAKVFEKKVMILGSISLSPSDLECVMLFLNGSFHKEWKKLGVPSKIMAFIYYIMDLQLVLMLVSK